MAITATAVLPAAKTIIRKRIASKPVLITAGLVLVAGALSFGAVELNSIAADRELQIAELLQSTEAAEVATVELYESNAVVIEENEGRTATIAELDGKLTGTEGFLQ